MSKKETAAGVKAATEEVKKVSEDAEKVSEAAKAPVKKTPGRKAMTAAEKAAAAKVRAEQKELAKNMKPVLLIQYQDVEKDVDALVEAAKAAFQAQKKRTLITDLKLYIKPEERAAYYVVNGEFTGKIDF